MAQTVLYLLNNTDNSAQVVIQPRTFDGEGGVQRNTDLTLYGNGAPNWGERFNENFYRLTENFAVAEKGGSTLFAPRDESDIGDGYGVNFPIVGQDWYNKTRSGKFVYTSSGWKPQTYVQIIASSLTPTTVNGLAYTPREGELAFDTSQNSLRVFRSGSWQTGVFTGNFVLKTGDTMSGTLSMGSHYITNVLNPINNQDAATKAYVDTATGGIAGKVNRSGDSMTGFLSLNANPVSTLHAATKAYVDAMLVSGMIMLWFGNPASPPAGWAICNGTNGTPDMRDRVPIGAGSSYSLNATGGATSTLATFPSHNHGGATSGHTLTVSEMPSHRHRLLYRTFSGYQGGAQGFYTTQLSGTPTYNDLNETNNNPNIENSGNNQPHTHPIPTETGMSTTINTLPPYRALYYIMKL